MENKGYQLMPNEKNAGSGFVPVTNAVMMCEAIS